LCRCSISGSTHSHNSPSTTTEPSQRFEIKLENDPDSDRDERSTQAIKESNLRLEPRLPLPDETCNERGHVTLTSYSAETTRTLAQLPLWYRGDYRVPETMLSGYASMAFTRLDQYNFQYFTAGQMEQVAGVLALANLCVQGKELVTADVVFALLEGDTMYVETLAQTIYWTGYIGPEDENPDEIIFGDTPPTNLTPDQTKDAYSWTLSEGPLLLLQESSEKV
jgi:hypothetical protein